MPPRKKGKGKKARKARAPPTERPIGREEGVTSLDVGNDHGDDDEEEELHKIEEMRTRMHDMLISSLGDGYDTESLKILDRKMCEYFLSEDSMYYGDKHIKSPNPDKPTDEEVLHYKKSDIIRKGVLRKATNFMATGNFLDGEGYKNLQLYQEFYDDLLTYHYAWFEIIFKDRSQLFTACNTLVKFAKVKIDMLPDIVSKTSERLDEVERLVTLLGEMKDDFQLSVKNHDKKGCEDAGYLEYDFYEIQYKMSLKMAQANRTDEADQYFGEALRAENVLGYWDEDSRYCSKVLEYATGRVILSLDEMDEMDMMENDGFFFLCLQAFLTKKKRECSMEI